MKITKEVLERECALLEAEPIIGGYTRADDLMACNPNFSSDKDGIWENNCQRCVLTYALRRRGIDVTAKPALLENDPMAGSPLQAGSKHQCWILALRHPRIISCEVQGDYMNGQKTRANIMATLQKMPEGAICTIRVIYEDFGHMFIAERINGQTVFFDPQQYGTPTQLNAESNLQNIRPDGAFICRLDNLDITPKMKECCRARLKTQNKEKKCPEINNC